MQARLKSSKKWTALPPEYVTQIKDVFHENFEAQLGKSKLAVDGRIYEEEVLLRVGIVDPSRLKQSNFEVSMQYDKKKKDAVERIHNCIDAVASMMADFFENEDEADLPRIWQEYPFQGKSVFLQYSTVNAALEAEADRLLGIANDALVNEDSDDEDALTRAEIDESLSDKNADSDEDDEEDEDDTDPAPRMFSGKKKKSVH